MKKIIFINFIFLIILLFFIEITFRIFFSYNVQGISKNLINQNISYNFNSPNLNYGKAFGVKIFTDSNGFRVKKNPKLKIGAQDIIFVGGSVTFGPGIKTQDTFVEKLNDVSKYNVKNASVIGTHFENNIEIIKNLESENIKKIFINFPLNNILSKTTMLDQEKIKKEEKSISSLRKNFIIGHINYYIRSQSAAYVFIKGLISNPQENNYKHDVNLYKNKYFLTNLEKNLIKITNIIDKEKIFFYSTPYAAQVKKKRCSKTDDPEKLLKQIFNKQNFDIIFLKEEMCKSKKPINFYLKNDPVHLNKEGHIFVYNYFQKFID